MPFHAGNRVTGDEVRLSRNCWSCRHIYFSTAEPNYSELTPGSDATLRCLKDVWDVNFYHDEQSTVRQMFEFAQRCKVFEPAKE